MMVQRFLTHKQTTRWLIHLLTAVLVIGLLIMPGVALADTPISGPVVVHPGGAQLYSAPNGDVIENLPIGAIVTVSGRTADNQWLIGVAPDGKAGWVQAAQMIAVGIDLLPVYSAVTDAGATAASDTNDVAASSTVSTTVANTSVPTATLTEQPAAQGQATPINTATTASNGAAVVGTVASGTDRLNIRSGPSTDYSIVDKATSGAQYPVIGRSEDRTWLQISLTRGAGWVSASYMTLQGDLTSLPVVTMAAPVQLPVIPASLTKTTPDSSASSSTSAATSAAQTTAPSSEAATGLSGTLVIETSPGGMMYGYSLDTGALWQLTTGFDPAISPDGKTVAFVRDGGDNGIYLINIDGSNEHLIFSGRARLSSPKWSPDGQYIVFTRGDGTYHCIDFGRSCVTPRSGPNGEEFSIPGVATQTRSWYNLARVDRDGNNYRDIPSLTSAKAADWNQAGIVYESSAGLQITADTPDDQNRLVIFDYLKPFFNDPDWQPNGGKIVYMGKEASHWEIFAVNPDGSGKVALTQPETTVVNVIPSNVAPAWSPDGKHIVFLSNREDNHEAGKWRVWVMDADGSNQHPLPINLDINYTFGDEQSVDWSS